MGDPLRSSSNKGWILHDFGNEAIGENDREVSQVTLALSTLWEQGSYRENSSN